MTAQTNKERGEAFSQWAERVMPHKYARAGRRSAWDYGAKAAMGAPDYGRIYHRSDCMEAEENGRKWGLHAVASCRPILCPCCGQPFPAFLNGAKGTSSVAEPSSIRTERTR